MPAISYIYETDSGDVTTTSETYQDVGCTAVLTEGRWLIIGQCNFRNETGIGASTEAAEVEARHNSTRIAVGRWCTEFGSFNTGDSAAGGVLQFHAVVDAAEDDEISMWVRAVDPEAYGGTVRAGSASLICINLDDLVEGSDYWFADSGSGDTAETSITGTSFVEGDTDGQLEVTIPEDGDYLWLAYAEGFNTAAITSGEGYQARWRIDGVNSAIDITQVIVNIAASVPFIWPNFSVLDVRNYSENDTPRAEWEFANTTTGTDPQARRTRTFLLRLNAVTNYAFIVNAGGIQASGGSDVEGSNGLTFDSGTDDYVVLCAAAAEPGTSDWGDAALHRDESDVDFPDGGKLQATIIGTDSVGGFMFGTVQAAGEHTWRLVQRTDPSATTYTLGRNADNSGDARTPLIAFTLSVPDTDNIAGTTDITFNVSGTVTGYGAIAGTSALTFSQTAAITGYGAVVGSAPITLATGTSTLTGIGDLSGNARIRFSARWTIDEEQDDEATFRLWQAGVYTLDLDRPRVWSCRNW